MPMDPHEKERIRQNYYRELASGSARLPNHDFTRPETVAPPTPKAKALAQIGKNGIEPIKQDEQKPVKEKTSKGALVEDDSVDPALSQDPNAIDPTQGGQTQGPGGAPDPTIPPINSEDQEQGPDTDDEDGADLNQLKKEEGTVVQIPDNFRDLPWNDARALARNFTDAVVTNKANAIEIIEGELAHRANNQ